MGNGRNGNQEDASESVNSDMNVTDTINCDPLWSDLADEVWKAPQHRVEHKILRSDNDARSDCPHDVGQCFANVSAPEPFWMLSSSPEHHVTFENKVIDHAQCCYDQKHNPDQHFVRDGKSPSTAPDVG